MTKKKNKRRPITATAIAVRLLIKTICNKKITVETINMKKSKNRQKASKTAKSQKYLKIAYTTLVYD